MNVIAKHRGRILVTILLAVLLALGLVWRAAYRAANLSETVMVLSNVSGADIEVVYTNSDTLAKQEDMSVYISASNSRASWVPKGLRKKTLLFRYDPGTENPLPSITSPAPGQLIITIPRVSSIALQRTRWEGVLIAYNIGRVDYP